MRKRAISLLTAVLLCLSMLPFTTAAAYETDYKGRLLYNGHTYRYYTDTMNWEDAESYCESQGGHLVTITSEGEQNAIFEYLQDVAGDTDIWIGFKDTETEGDWSTWVTGEAVTYTNWGYGEPDDGSGGQDHGVICSGSRSGSGYNIEPGQWDDRQSGSRTFICEWDYTMESPYEVDSQGRIIYNGHTYFYYTDSMNWENAESYCESQGGHLVTITSEGEQNALYEYIQDVAGNTDIWIGFNDAETEGDWSTWVTGEAVTYTNWGSSEPDDGSGGQDYGVICNGLRSGSGYRIEQGQWDDLQNGSRTFICEWDYALTTSNWASPEIEEAYQEGLIPEELAEEDLTETVDRAEFAAIAVKLYEALTGTTADAVSTPFSDISGSGYADYIAKAYGLNISVGVSETEFQPDTDISREQLATMLCRTVKKFSFDGWTYATDSDYYLDTSGVKTFADDAQISAYAKPSVYYMAKFGVILGYEDNTFRPKASAGGAEAEGYSQATREQALVMSLRIFRLKDTW